MSHSITSSPTSLFYDLHKEDKVTWYLWGEEALQKAMVEDKPIFLFIGHSTSEWCRLMRETSFMEEQVTTQLGNHFIPILVDKEERPDIYAYYQKVYKAMHKGLGGTPLSVFLTPHLTPFYITTYISTQSEGKRLSFIQLLASSMESYTSRRERIIEEGETLLESIRRRPTTIQATKLDATIFTRTLQHASHLFNAQEGGFGESTPKFPQVSILQLLVTTYRTTKEKNALNMVTYTLQQMAEGGLHDTKEGGFFRYTKEKAWSLPHFAKTAYDNALLAEVYLDVYQETGETFYQKIAFETLEFMVSQMMHQNLFYSALLTTPHTIDTTFILSWNAMAVKTLFKAGALDEKYLTMAEISLQALLSQFNQNNQLLRTPTIAEMSETTAFLEDYAYLAEALLEAYRVTQKETYLSEATTLANSAIEHYAKQGEWLFSVGNFETQAEVYDTLYPSSLSTMVNVLLTLAGFVNPAYKTVAFKILERYSYEVMRQPLSTPRLTTAVIRYLENKVYQ
jgi:uncharacterized protein YyaL (SSP411 family)